MKRNPRKKYPVFEGLFKYFPKALMEVAHVSGETSRQHNPGKIRWDRTKSTDNADALLRHLIDHARGDEFDNDGVRHLSKVAWRALATLEIELEREL